MKKLIHSVRISAPVTFILVMFTGAALLDHTASAGGWFASGIIVLFLFWTLFHEEK